MHNKNRGDVERHKNILALSNADVYKKNPVTECGGLL